MTRLFNLTSYPELCSYAHLYKQEIKIPNGHSFPSAYKNFFDTYSDRGYICDSSYPEALFINLKTLPFQSTGTNLSEGDRNLYIVPDGIDLLTLEANLKQGEKYLFKSAYHYWNYLNQITERVDLTQPVVFIDLNAVDQQHYSLRFTRSEGSPYKIPVLNFREKLDLSLNIKNEYDAICRALSHTIIEKYFPELRNNATASEHLIDYLKKIQLFHSEHCCFEQDTFLLKVEINFNRKVYFKTISFKTAWLEDAVYSQNNWQLIKKALTDDQEHYYIVVSDYNSLPAFRNLFDGDNVFAPDTQRSQFNEIWLHKQQEDFPLFGQYLDQIEFQISISGESRWIKLLSVEESNRIYYEGKTDEKGYTKIIGKIQDTEQVYFNLPHPEGTLPIKINGEDYLVNNIPQSYAITHPPRETETLQVRLEFLLKPGCTPDLKVKDIDDKYEISPKLKDCPKTPENYSYIPWKKIEQKRQQNSNNVPTEEQRVRMVDLLSKISIVDCIEQAIRQKRHVDKIYSVIHRTRNDSDLLLGVNCNHPFLEDLQKSVNDLYYSGIVDVASVYINNPLSSINSRNELNAKSFFKRLIIFLGKLYSFSDSLKLEQFYSQTMIQKGRKLFNQEYFYFLSRIAVDSEKQKAYFNCFFNSLQGNKFIYLLEDYLWGYGRILAWYTDFREIQKELDYIGHFKAILNQLIHNSKFQGRNFSEYQRNAFVSLIYLLTFKEFDKEFCCLESEEFQSSEEVVRLYEDYPCYLRSVSRDKSLNVYFKELLDGQSSEESVRKLLEAD